LHQTTQLADLTMVIARKDLEVQRANEDAKSAAKEADLAQQRTIFASLHDCLLYSGHLLPKV
jgi:hypothetical protein